MLFENSFKFLVFYQNFYIKKEPLVCDKAGSLKQFAVKSASDSFLPDDQLDVLGVLDARNSAVHRNNEDRLLIFRSGDEGFEDVAFQLYRFLTEKITFESLAFRI